MAPFAATRVRGLAPEAASAERSAGARAQAVRGPVASQLTCHNRGVATLLTVTLLLGAAVFAALGYRILTLSRRYRVGEKEKNFEVEARVLIANAKKRGAPPKCPKCGKTLLSDRAPRCLYCGAALAKTDAEGATAPEAR
jgi:hypothetical protein